MKRRRFLKSLSGFLGSAAIIPAENLIGKSLPAAKETFVLSTHIAGTTYIKGINRLAAKFSVGDSLSLVRELNNEYDDLAVKVIDSSNQKLGYLPMDENEVISRLIDAGFKFKVKIKNIQKIDYWNKISIDVFMNN